MTREELIEKMAIFHCNTMDGERGSMAAALDVAVGELLGEPTTEEIATAMHCNCENCVGRVKDAFNNRRSHYLKPKSDPAVGAVMKLWVNGAATAEEIVAAVRAADKEAHARL